MIEFLQQKGMKAYRDVMDLCRQPDLLFSNDEKQVQSEARYNMWSIQSFNKLLKNNRIPIQEVALTILYIERSMEKYLRNFYHDKAFFWREISRIMSKMR